MDMDQADSAPGAQGQVNMVPAGSRLAWLDHPSQVDSQAWDTLVSGVEGGTPFLRHGFLRAMVESGSACADTGWRPRFLVVHDAQGHLLGACPVFLKSHSYGEYVFDWAWADAHDRALAAHGHSYFPKLLSASPFSPIPGVRLLVRPGLSAPEQASVRQLMLRALSQACEDEGWSSAHLLFTSPEETRLAQEAGWLVRQGVQFHWQNREPDPYASFEDFLASMQRDKRKKIQQERRKVREAGVTFEVLEGSAITEAHWDFFHRCYTRTYLEHGQRPYLDRRFWSLASQAGPDQWVMFTASLGGERIAASLLAVDPLNRLAFGRYWGALQTVSCLHFEACYHQPLAWCIERGMRRFEGGAQGEHKLARGLLPSPTRSVHWLRHPGLREAVADFLQRESQGIGRYVDELEERAPFKPSGEPTQAGAPSSE